MALSAAQKTQVFEIFGIPETGSGTSYPELMGEFGASGDTYDMSRVLSQVTSILNALSASQEARVAALLTRHAAITSSSPLQVHGAAGGARGVLVDHPGEREAIRAAIGTIVGVAVPMGGFVAEAGRKARGAGRVGR